MYPRRRPERLSRIGTVTPNSIVPHPVHVTTSHTSGGKSSTGTRKWAISRLDGQHIRAERNRIPAGRAGSDAANQLVMAKWIIRNLAYNTDSILAFAPKITGGKAGSGLHIHMRIMKDGKNQMLDADGELSETARQAIAGMMTLAPSITAFGNAQILPLTSASFLIRRLRRTFAGATATVPYSYVYRWDGRLRRICVCLPILWRLRAIMTLLKNKRWRCARRTVLPICTN